MNNNEGFDKLVYLCGPITGRQIDWGWRAQARARLAREDIGVLDPLAGKLPGTISNGGLLLGKEIVPVEYARRDKDNVIDADIVLAHFPYVPEERPIIGSFMEFGWAEEMGKPLVISSHPQAIRDHLFVRAFAHSIHEHIDGALDEIIHLVLIWRER